MRAVLFDRICFSVVITSMLIHLFCCGIPLLLSIGSLAAIIGISGTEWAYGHWLEGYEQTILLASGAVLMINAIVQALSERIHCRVDGSCAHAPCDSKRNYARIVFFVALGLYVLNLAFYFAAH